MKTNRLTALAVAVSSVFALSAAAGETEWWDVDFTSPTPNNVQLESGELGALTNDATLAAVTQPYASGVWFAYDSDESYVTNEFNTVTTNGVTFGGDNCLRLDTQGNDLTWTPTNIASGVQTLVDVDLFLVGSDSAPTEFDDKGDVQTAIYLKNLVDDAPGGSGETTNSVLCVYVYDENIESNVWVTLAGTELEDNSWAHILVTVDHSLQTPMVSVQVNGTNMHAANDDSDSWQLANPSGEGTTSGKINSISFRGTGAVDNFVGSTKEVVTESYEFTAQVYIGNSLQAVDTEGNFGNLTRVETFDVGDSALFEEFVLADFGYDDSVAAELGQFLCKVEIVNPETEAVATYTYSWDDNNDKVVPDSQEANPYVTFVTDPDDGHETGYFFVSVPTVNAVSNTVVARIYFTDLSAPTTYDITFYDWDNTLIGTTSVVANATGYGPATDPVRANYTFDGWTNAVVGGPLYATADLPAADANATYTAVYSESATPPEPTPVNPGSNLKPEDFANGVKPVEVTAAGFVVKFRGEAGMTYELLATDDLSITEAQWKALTPVATEDCTTDDDLITLTAPMTEDAQFFKIGVSVTTP